MLRVDLEMSDICPIASRNPACEDCAKAILSYRQGLVCIIIGVCKIEYEGRARSYADFAPRMLIVKPDGTVLIHEASKREPLNWQPPGSRVDAKCGNGKLIVISRRTSPPETISIEFNRVEMLVLCRLASTYLRVLGTEEDLVASIVRNPSIIEPGAEVVGRDIPTPMGKVDVVLRARDGSLIVVEVKNEKAGVSAVAQLKRYVEHYNSLGVKVKGILVAPSLSEEARRLMAREGFRFISSTEFSKGKVTSLDRYFK